MSGIHGLGQVALRGPAQPRAGTAGFGPAVGKKASAAGVAAAAAPASLLGLLALQEGETDAARDRAARRHGDALLRELAALQRGLLGDADDLPGTLARLAALTEEGGEAANPDLAGIVRAVTLRARIELARRVPAVAAR